MSILRDFYDPLTEFGEAWDIADQVSEGETEVDGVEIIGKVKGPMFVPGGNSLNGRHYTNDLWEFQLKKPDVKKRLEDRLMYGTIGHDDRPVNEADLRNGVASHVMTRLWIEDRNGKKVGMGEALIFGTPAGKNLKMYLKARSKLKTSSRANGKFESRRTPEGVPIVDKNNYILETFDFVIKPGFPQTDPQLQEDLNSEQNNESMDFNETLMRSRDSLQTQVTELLSEKRALDARIQPLETEIKTLKEQLAGAPKVPVTLNKMSEDLGYESLNGLGKVMEVVDPSALAIIAEHQVDGDTIKAYLELGTPEEISQLSMSASELLEEYKKVGAEEGEVVTPEEIQGAIDTADQALREYRELGTVAEIKSAMARLEELEGDEEEKEIEDKAMELSKEYKADVAIVEKLLRGLGMDNDCEEVKETLEQMRSSGSRRSTSEPTSTRKNGSKNESRDDDDDLPPALQERHAGRFFARLTSPTTLNMHS